jgi:hypothetical protein
MTDTLKTLRNKFRTTAERLQAQTATIQRYVEDGLLPVPPPDDVQQALIHVSDTCNELKVIIYEIQDESRRTEKASRGQK